MKQKRGPNDQRVTVYLPDGAVAGRVLRFREIGLEAWMERGIPRDERYRFTLHLRSGVIAGEVTCTGQEDRLCRFQYASLSDRDRERLAPLVEEE